MELIKISQNATGQSVVSARELHGFLQAQTRFNDWIERRITDFQFTENQDFVKIYSKLSKTKPATDYALTLDMAKELAMLERSPKGKQARQYFIECEKALREMEANAETPLTKEEAEAKLDYELAAANNLLSLIDTSIENKLLDFRRLDMARFEHRFKTMLGESVSGLRDLVIFALQQIGASEVLENRKAKTSYVYLMRQTSHPANFVGCHFCKIGKSNDPEKRLLELELGGCTLEIVEKIAFETEAQAIAWENILHLTFDKSLTRREWYVLEDRHVEFFRRLSGLVGALLL